MTPISAVVITRDAASQLAKCLDSLAFCDEILVVDSGSTDGTIELARRRGARVIETHWRGFGAQKQFAVEQAAHDWVLCVDADEWVSGILKDSICAALGAPSFPAYRFARCNRFMGRYLRHGEGYPDLSLRLFDRRHAHWSSDAVHERVVADGPVGVLAGDLMHDSAESLERYLEKQNRYSSLAAQAQLAAGKKSSLLRLVGSPLIRFIKFYVLRLGFLDGLPGLVHISIGCFASFAKHAKMLAAARR
ncbi:glycosyltransferase family 2 protein [Sulfuricystis multivorans]|uniref:glycosyltransferase family 2 protein n=1 Tax=Sulfuricystis multivorans TaxID=2211108 RepID=UPI000F833E9A|nr:glycosyltransferase family 2 protein [Sulfuricystis multivorans]